MTGERTIVLEEVREVGEGRAVRVCVDDHDIALWRVEGELYAIAVTCPHQHFASLHNGTLEDFCVTCPMHGWSFSLRSGRAVRGSGRVQVYAVREEHGRVHLTLPANGPDSHEVGQ